MEYRKLGHSGLEVSRLCLGTMTFGEADESSFMHGVGADEQTSRQVLNRALDEGINLVDTADVYGNDGLTEKVLGRWFEADGRRDEVVLASKFRFRMHPGPNGTGASRYHIVRAVEESLRRLKTDRIDLYQIHMQDTQTPEEETLRALDDLVRAGKVLYLGASNYAAYRLVESLWASDARNLERFVSLQARYSLVARELEREHLPACRRFGLGVLPYSPLAGGFLSGKYTRESRPEGARLSVKDERFQAVDTEKNWRVLAEVRRVAEEVDATPAQVALAWLLRQDRVTSVIFGARSVRQLEDNLRCLEVPLSDDQLGRLDQVSALDWDYPYEFLNRVMGRW